MSTLRPVGEQKQKGKYLYDLSPVGPKALNKQEPSSGPPGTAGPALTERRRSPQ